MMSNCKAACKSVKHHCREGTCLDAGDTEPTPLPRSSNRRAPGAASAAKNPQKASSFAKR